MRIVRIALFVVLTALAAAPSAHAKKLHARPHGEVTVSVSLRDQVAVRVWLSGVKATSTDELHDLLGIVDGLALDEGRLYVTKQLAAMTNADKERWSLDSVPDAPMKSKTLSRLEAKALLKWLAPTPERPQDAAFGMILEGVRESVEDALAGKL